MKYEDIKKVIESCHLNFLIGSGASKPFLNTLTDIEKALDNLQKKVGLSKEQDNPSVLKVIEVSIKHYYFKKCIERNIELLTINDKSNETLNTYIDLLQSIQTILVKRSTNIISKQVNLFTTNMDVFFDVALEQLGYSINDGFSGRMNPKFGTENFHNIINKVSSHYEYQSTVPLFNLFKLHGSLNWKLNKENETIYFDGELSITKNLTKIQFNEGELVECFESDRTLAKYQFEESSIEWSDVIEKLFQNGWATKIDSGRVCLTANLVQEEVQMKKIFNDDFSKILPILQQPLNGKVKGLSEIYNSAKEIEISGDLNVRLDSFLSTYDQLIMVNPNKDKFEETTLKYSYYELLRMYSNNLERENSILLVSGFSFADEHICKITTRVAKANPTLLILIFAFDDKSEQEIKARLGTAANIIYLPRENGDFFLRTVNEFYIGRLAKELISPSKEKTEMNEEKKEEDGQ